MIFLITGTATIMISHLKREHKVIVEVIPYKKPKDPERFKCQHCGKCFMDSRKLKMHVNTHTGERPFVCDHCGKRFANSSNCYAHVKQSHLGKKRIYNRNPKPKSENTGVGGPLDGAHILPLAPPPLALGSSHHLKLEGHPPI